MILPAPLPPGIVLPANVAKLDPRSTFEPPLVVQAKLSPDNKIHIGAFTGIYGGRVGHCTIGRYCSIAPEVDIASDQHPVEWLSSSMLQYVPNVHAWGDWLRAHGHDYHLPRKSFVSNTPVTIGNDVWLGQNVFVKSGVRIGDGAIIAAHSVVIDDIPPYAIAAGVPARVKRYRFPPETIERLLALQWWRYNIAALPQLDFTQVDKAIATLSAAVERGELMPYEPELYTLTD